MLPSYLHITKNIETSLQEVIEGISPARIAVLMDDNTVRHCLPLVKNILKDAITIIIPPGEKYKSIQSCEKIWEQLTKAQFDRHDLLINLGGGLIGDMGGFAASTFKRGIAFINVPTTLLSQVDASIGGKLGINFRHFKNHLGVFREPDAVLVSQEFLKTLPEAELRSGFAEVLKHGIIADEKYFHRSLESWAAQTVREDSDALVATSIGIKQQIVLQDPTEKGPRKLLNLGHTIGHAMESYFMDNSTILHGEAVAAGIILAAGISANAGLLDQIGHKRIVEGVDAIYERIALSAQDITAITALTVQDKKNKGGKINMVLPNSIGSCQYDVEVSSDTVNKALKAYSLH